MAKHKSLMGQRFGRLVAVRRVLAAKPTYLCYCDCGGKANVRTDGLKSGRAQSCGCWKRDVQAERNTSHGKSKTKTYRSWADMLSRCSNPGLECYTSYGGRGISVCVEWHSFERFLADMGECPPRMTLDRKNNDGDYEPGNCRWATCSQQLNNQRRTLRATIDGVTKSITDWAREMNLNPGTIRTRVYQGGMTAEEALLAGPRMQRGKKNPRPVSQTGA